MARLTKKQRWAIETALRNAERAQAYIMSDRIAVCAVGRHATTTMDFTQANGDPFSPNGKPRVLTPLTKEYGSDLVGLPNAIAELKSLLASPG